MNPQRVIMTQVAKFLTHLVTLVKTYLFLKDIVAFVNSDWNRILLINHR